MITSCVLEKIKEREKMLEGYRTIFLKWMLEVKRTSRTTFRSTMFYKYALDFINEQERKEAKKYLKKIWNEKIQDGTLIKKPDICNGFTFSASQYTLDDI